MKQRRARFWIACLVIGLGPALAGFRVASAAGEDTSRPRGLILISIDTLRPDHLGPYGYERATTPHLDRFAADAIRFETVVAQAPSTLPSHASLFTSLPPALHGALLGRRAALSSRHVTLAEILKEAGYHTAAFHGGVQMAKRFGLDQGFEVYEEVNGSFADTVARATAWIEGHPENDFFLFLHSYAVHHPYTPSKESLALLEPAYEGPLPDEISVELLKRINAGEVKISDRDLEHIKNTYDAEIRDMDAALERRLAQIEAGN